MKSKVGEESLIRNQLDSSATSIQAEIEMYNDRLIWLVQPEHGELRRLKRG